MHAGQHTNEVRQKPLTVDRAPSFAIDRPFLRGGLADYAAKLIV